MNVAGLAASGGDSSCALLAIGMRTCGADEAIDRAIGHAEVACNAAVGVAGCDACEHLLALFETQEGLRLLREGLLRPVGVWRSCAQGQRQLFECRR